MIPTPAARLSTNASQVGDFVVHTHCEDLSLAQQLAGVRELCRHLALIERERGSQAQRTMHLCLLNSLAKASPVYCACVHPHVAQGCTTWVEHSMRV